MAFNGHEKENKTFEHLFQDVHDVSERIEPVHFHVQACRRHPDVVHESRHAISRLVVHLVG